MTLCRFTRVEPKLRQALQYTGTQLRNWSLEIKSDDYSPRISIFPARFNLLSSLAHS